MKTKRVSKKQWDEVVGEFKKSGMTPKQFSAENNIKVEALYRANSVRNHRAKKKKAAQRQLKEKTKSITLHTESGIHLVMRGSDPSSFLSAAIKVIEALAGE